MDNHILRLILLLIVYLNVIHCNPSSELAPSLSDNQNGVTGFIQCASRGELGCFLDIAEDLVNQKRIQYLAEAENMSTGRATDTSKPSHMVKYLNRLITEFTDLLRDGMSGFFSNAKEAEDDSEIKEATEEARGKKKKKKEKIKLIIKLLLIGAVLKAKLTLLLKLLSAALQVKFFLVAFAGLVLNAARFYLDYKKGHNPQKVIYYEHAQHQHHYEGGDEDWASSGPAEEHGGGGYWGRSYDEVGKSKTAQDLAYAKQKPYVHKTVTGTPSNSWFFT